MPFDVSFDVLTIVGGLLAGLALAFFILFAPSSKRLGIALSLMVLWLGIGHLSGLGVVATLAKAASVLPFIVIAILAHIHPVRKRRTPPVVFLYPVVAMVAVIYVLHLADSNTAIVIRLQWLAITVAGVKVARVTASIDGLRYLARWLGFGSLALTIVFIIGVAIDPSSAFVSGHRRLVGLGDNPNQAGLTLASSIPLLLYLSFTERNRLLRFCALSVGIVGCGLVLLTASRQSLALLLLPTVAVLASWRKSAVWWTPVIIVLLIILGPRFLELADRFGRLDRLAEGYEQSMRLQIFKDYIHVGFERPLSGVLFTEGMHSTHDSSIGHHPHNMFLYWFYLGGIPLLVPMLVLMAYTLLCTSRVLMRIRAFGKGAPVVLLFAAFMISVYANGIVTQRAIHPTYSWAFLHVALSCVFLTIGSERSVRTKVFDPTSLFNSSTVGNVGFSRTFSVGRSRRHGSDVVGVRDDREG